MKAIWAAILGFFGSILSLPVVTSPKPVSLYVKLFKTPRKDNMEIPF